MYFYLSKTLGDLAVPSNFVLLIIICSLLLWRSRFAKFGRRMTIVGVILLLVGGLLPIGNVLLLPLENRFPPWNPSRGAPTGIIVLGGVINTHISFLRNEISLGPAASRLVAAVELYRRYPNARVVFSGGNSNVIFKGASEARFAALFLKNMGVPDNAIAIDGVSRNTMENAVNAKKIADPKPGDHWILITSASHMPRAMGLFRAAGFPVEACPVDYKTGGWHDLASLPSFSLLGDFTRLDLATHEWEGLFIDWITGRTSTLLPGPVEKDAIE